MALAGEPTDKLQTPRLGWYAINILRRRIDMCSDLNMPGSAAGRVIPSQNLGWADSRWLIYAWSTILNPFDMQFIGFLLGFPQELAVLGNLEP
jgi:hypothetical protein